MADKQDTATERPAEPHLIAPKRETVVDGAAVTFEWEEVEDAEEYHLQVGTDNHLDNVIYKEDIRGKTKHTVEEVFETDGRTYYWNVWARNEAGLSDTEYVESFVSATTEQSDQMTRDGTTTGDEDYGPAGELMRAATAEMAAEATGSEAYFEREREMGVAHEGIEAGEIMAISLSILVAIGLIVVTLFVMVDLQAETQRRAVTSQSRYPGLQETQARAADRLGQYAIVDDQEEVYRIPIDRAMNVMVNEAYQQENQKKASYSEELSFISGN